MKKIFLSLMIIVSFVFGDIGKITSLKGEVMIYRASKEFPASVGFVLQKNDELRTKDKSKALILFNDGTSITVGKESVLKINEYVQDSKTAKNNKANFGFGKGVFRTITGQIGKANPDGFKMETKTSSLGIRGSDGTTIVSLSGDVKHTTNSGGFYIINKFTGQIFEIPKGITASFMFGDDVRLSPTTTVDVENSKEVSDEISQDLPLLGDNAETTEILESPNLNTNSAEINEVPKVIAPQIAEEYIDVEPSVAPVKLTDIMSITPQGAIESLGVDLSSVTKEVVGNDTYNGTSLLEYGYILQNNMPTSTYLTGITTPSMVIDEYISTNQTASYNGNIASFANGVSAANGTISLDMNFGTRNFTGNINIGNNNWIANIDSGTISSYGFNTTNISTGTSSVVQNISGSLSGKFYGPTASSVGGAINLSSGSNTINGVFGGNK